MWQSQTQCEAIKAGASKLRQPRPAASGLLQVPPEGPDILPSLQHHPVLETPMLLTMHTQESHLSIGVPWPQMFTPSPVTSVWWPSQGPLNKEDK